MTQIGVGLIGYGNAGRIFHAPLILAEPRLDLRLIGSRDFSDKTLPEGVSGRPVADVINAPGIDLIVIATPNDSHAPLAELALKAGKHVVIDKPFALTADQAQGVVELARGRARRAIVFQNRRWDGGFLTVRKAVEDGQLGPISYGAFHFDRYSPVIKDRWREWDGPGAGILHDLGPHLFDQIVVLFGKPDAVTATLARQRDGARVDDFFHAVLEYGTTRIVAHASSLMPDHGPRIALYGARGSLFQYGFDGQEAALKEGAVPGEPRWGVTAEARVEVFDANGTRTDPEVMNGQYEAFYARVAAALLDGAEPPVSSEDALNVMRVLDAARLSAETGQRIALAPCVSRSADL